jgi:TolA-binding protein
VFRRASFLTACALMGCAGARPTTDLDAQLRQLRQEQQRQARQIELLEQRVVIAEDTARLARQTMLGPRPTVRIAPDGSEGTRGEPLASAGGPAGGEDEPTPEPEPSGPRPMVRAVGRQAPPPSATPIVVREDDRLPVAPVPAQLAPPSREPRSTAPRERGPESALPTTDPPALTAEVPAALAGVSSARDPRAVPAYEQALAHARGGRCPEGIEALGAFLVRWPDHPYASNAMYWRAECILAGGDVRRAIAEFEGLLARFPVGNKAPDALYKLVICYRRVGDEARARDLAARLLREHPRSSVADRLRGERNAT